MAARIVAALLTSELHGTGAPALGGLGSGHVITGTVRAAAGRYRIATAPTIAQFGEPDIHVGYDDEDSRSSRWPSATRTSTAPPRS